MHSQSSGKRTQWDREVWAFNYLWRNTEIVRPEHQEAYLQETPWHTQLYPMVLHPSCTRLMPFTAISIASAAAGVHSQGSRSPCSGTAGFGPNTVFTSVTSKIGREQGPICISQGCEWGKESHRWTSVTSDGEMGPSLVLLPKGNAVTGQISLLLVSVC